MELIKWTSWFLLCTIGLVTGYGVTANMLALGASDSGFESQYPDKFINNFLKNMDFNLIWWGNTMYEYTTAIVAFVVLSVVFMIIQKIVLMRLASLAKKTKTDLDDVLIDVIRSIRPPFYYFLALYIAILSLTLSSLVSSVVTGILVAWVVYQGVIALSVVIDYALIKKAGDSPSTYGFLSKIIKWVLYSIGFLLVLSNLGVDVTSLIAGLGIGGIAIAFALQNILSDLFSSFAIHLDKPFEEGDYIVVGEHRGTIEHIGVKSTRMRSINGEEIVISNQELTSAQIQNYRDLAERRASFSFGVLYETDSGKVKKIPDMIKSIFDKIESVRLDRAHFKSFGDSSLDFEVVYYVQSSEYGRYMDIQQNINFALMEQFEKEGIEFAYPTQTLYVKK